MEKEEYFKKFKSFLNFLIKMQYNSLNINKNDDDIFEVEEQNDDEISFSDFEFNVKEPQAFFDILSQPKMGNFEIIPSELEEIIVILKENDNIFNIENTNYIKTIEKYEKLFEKNKDIYDKYIENEYNKEYENDCKNNIFVSSIFNNID